MKERKLPILVDVFFVTLTFILGFFAGAFLTALYTALFNVGADIFGLTVGAIVPIIFFAFILYIDKKHRNHNFGSFLAGFIVGFLIISILLHL